MHFVPQLIPNGLAALVLLGFSLYGWSKRKIPYTLPFAGIMLLGAFWGICSSIELASEALAAKVLWRELHFLATTLIPVLLVWIVLKLRGRSQWLTPRRFFIFLIEPAAVLVLALSGWGGRLFFSDMSLSYAGPVPMLVSAYKPLYWVHVVYSYALLSFSCVLFASWARDSLPRFRSQSASVSLAILFPGLVNALSQIGLSPLPGIDLTPVGLVATGVLASLAIFRFRLVDITPIAGRLIVQTMEDLNLVVDARDNLVDFNPSARSAIGIDPRRAAGRTLKELPPPWPDVFAPYSGMSSARETIRVELPEGVRWYHLAVLALRNESGAAVGRLFHLHDITERKEIEEELQGSREQLAQAQKM
ncbi:MAG: histidine kinase N-terminal 7TM domain-containing protein, partial [Spirochaetia bacterium]